MRQRKAEPNEFELAILRSLSRQAPHEAPFFDRLHVLSREFTGVGSFTKFAIDEIGVEIPNKWPLHLKATIHMPTVPSGLGALLFYTGPQPECLEVHTYGNEHWDGAYDGYSIEEKL
jgi:hypothetical protein